jgi:hypothetical protein
MSETLPVAHLSLTAVPQAEGGNAKASFTIGMRLASHANPESEEAFQIPLVDIVMLAVVKTLQETPDEFKANIDFINTAIRNLDAALETQDPAEAIEAFNATIGMPIYVAAQ